jgi:ubiquinone/menaquinone biosynthesis C-methylase UbiE
VPPGEERVERFRAVVRDAGPLYGALYAVRWLLRRAVDAIEGALVARERRMGIVAPWTIAAHRFTVAQNREWWNRHDWSALGEEWTPDAGWKTGVVERFLIPNVAEDATVVEIGPGGGRWTEHLQPRARQLFLVDVSERVLDLCRARFAQAPNIQYRLTDRARIDVPDASIDVIWSYDVFVHINPIDAKSYFREFARVLKSQGRAVIHHPGAPPSGGSERPQFRSELTSDMVKRFAADSGLELVEQTTDFVNHGDVLSIFRR